ncbi:Senescence-associated protein [Rhizoctonia solani]|uniref:Senescence-associated protein n=1 Tax=Rhizoctonia solani TaxID=456999 RepID=A0A8H7I516_9AGAM|nr:Senescence-associated protein [Rhizoctonia solani]
MAAPLVSFENCTAVQVLSSQDVPLASGTLQILSAEPTDSASPTAHSTDASVPFDFKDRKCSDIATPGSDAEKSRDAFEEVLLNHGLLQEGTAAFADELASGAREAGLKAASSIKGVASSHTSGPPAEPSSFSSTTHQVADSAVSGTETIKDYTASASGASIGATAGNYLSKATETVAKAGVAVGERLVHLFGMEDQVQRVASETASDRKRRRSTVMAPATLRSLGTIGSGVKEGTSEVTSAAREAATSVLEHDAGPEAVELANKGGQAAGNLTQATGDALLATSAVATAGYAAAGATESAVKAETKEDSPSEAPEVIPAEPVKH